MAVSCRRTSCVLLLSLFLALQGVDGGVKLAHLRHQAQKGQPFQCSDGSKVVKHVHLNDGYCDCEDGSDEPVGSHCNHQRFECGPRASSKLLFKSRQNDGKCDCCDGSDEPRGHCKDTCETKPTPHHNKHIRKSNNHLSPTDLESSHHNRHSKHNRTVESSIDAHNDRIRNSELGDELNPTIFHSPPDEFVNQFIPETKITVNGGDSLVETLDDLGDVYQSPDRDLDEEESKAVTEGYYRDPAIHNGKIVFISEDDLWVVDVAGGKPRRLTSGVGQVWRPRISEDGKWIAFSGSDEGSPDVYVMPFEGGRAKRLTFLGDAMVVSWSSDNSHIVFSTGHSQFHDGQNEELFKVNLKGGQPKPLGVGWSSYLSYGRTWCEHCIKPQDECSARPKDSPDGCPELCEANWQGCVFDDKYLGFSDVKFEGVHMTPANVIGRHITDIARWKRYKGGMRGRLWVDLDGAQEYEPLITSDGNIGMFAWVHKFVVFVSDMHCPQPPVPGEPCTSQLYMTPLVPDSIKQEYDGSKKLPVQKDLEQSDGDEDGGKGNEDEDEGKGNEDEDAGNGNEDSQGNNEDQSNGDQQQQDVVQDDNSQAQEVVSDGKSEQSDKAAAIQLTPADRGKGSSVEERVKARTKATQMITAFEGEYIRHPVASWVADEDNNVIVVFTAGADLYYVKIGSEMPSGPLPVQKVPVEWNSPQTQRQRRFQPVTPQITHYSLNSNAEHIAYIARGRLFLQQVQEDGVPMQYGVRQGVRYTQIDFLPSGDLLAVAEDTASNKDGSGYGSDSRLEIFKIEGATNLQSESLAGGRMAATVGRVEELVASPVDNMVAYVNHEYRLTVFDVEGGKEVCTMKASYDNGIQDIAWSPDGYWIAFTIFVAPEVSIIRMLRVKEGVKYNSDFVVCRSIDVTEPLVRDHSPSWDPSGKFLHFLSTRDFDPSSDEVSQRSMAFLGGTRPFLVTLNGADESPFQMRRWDSEDVRSIVHRLQSTESQQETGEIFISLENIKNRIIAYPVSPGNYYMILGLPGRRVVYVRQPIEPELSARYILIAFDFVTQQEEILGQGVVGLTLTHDAQYLGVSQVSSPGPVCLIPSQYRGPLSSELMRCPNPNGVTFEVVPPLEWAQVFDETWRRARDNFWTGSMNGMDWDAVRERYKPLLARVGTRSELTDLVYQLQGELGTSHAFHKDYRHRTGPSINIGHLGCDVSWDASYSGYRIVVIYKGDLWSQWSGPLARPGLNIDEGDVIQKINGRAVTENMSLNEYLLGKSGTEIEVTILKFRPVEVESDHPFPVYHREPLYPVTINTEPLPAEGPIRYRDWVNNNRQYVDARTKGRVGYIHVPDMMEDGFAEFHRAYIGQASRDALIVDVRYNSGGFISDQLLDKTSRKTLGYVKSRWGLPEPYPHYSTAGPKVALINEACGSDCDIFSQNFCDRMTFPVPCLHTEDDVDTHCKRIGERTWGGVIGIDWKGSMVDFSSTSQPEYAHWFEEKGWSVENYGVAPDEGFEVHYMPQHYAAMYKGGAYRDPQLEKALEYIADVLSDQEYQKRQEQCVPDLRLGERA